MCLNAVDPGGAALASLQGQDTARRAPERAAQEGALLTSWCATVHLPAPARKAQGILGFAEDTGLQRAGCV